jgi:hypothetical protein
MSSRREERIMEELGRWRVLAGDLAGHLSGAITSDSLRRDGHRACCPDCSVTVQRYRAMRDGTSSDKFDPTTTPYAGDPRQR